MSLIDLGIGSSDFINNELSDFGTSVTHEVGTSTVDFRGTVTRGTSTVSTIDVVFHIREKTRVRTPEGMVEMAPAYMMSKLSDSIKKDDKIILQSGTVWKAWEAINRDDVFVFSDMYLWEDE